MKRYYVSVTETLNMVVSVDAESENEAVQKVQDAYDNSDIVLGSDNFAGEMIKVEEDDQYYKHTDNEYDGFYQHID